MIFRIRTLKIHVWHRTLVVNFVTLLNACRASNIYDFPPHKYQLCPFLLIVTAQNIPSSPWNASQREAPPALRTTDTSLRSLCPPPDSELPPTHPAGLQTLGLLRNTLLNLWFGFRHCLCLLLPLAHYFVVVRYLPVRFQTVRPGNACLRYLCIFCVCHGSSLNIE